MKLLKKCPKRIGAGNCVTIHFVPHAYEYNDKGQLCHVVKGYSVSKSKPFDGSKFETVESLTKKIRQELKRGKEKK